MEEEEGLLHSLKTLNGNFISDFVDFLSRFMFHYERILIVGDFNIHICCDNKPLVIDFTNVVESFDLTQSVFEPTHQRFRSGFKLWLVPVK